MLKLTVRRNTLEAAWDKAWEENCIVGRFAYWNTLEAAWDKAWEENCIVLFLQKLVYTGVRKSACRNAVVSECVYYLYFYLLYNI